MVHARSLSAHSTAQPGFNRLITTKLSVGCVETHVKLLSRYRTTRLYKSLCLAGIFRANLQLEFYFSV